MMLAIRPDLVNMEQAVDCPTDLWPTEPPFPSITGPGVYAIPTVETLPDGHAGTDPRQATAEKGHKILEILADCVAEVLQALASTPTPPAFRGIWRKPLPGNR